MDNVSFGLRMTILGMGGTLAVIWLLSLAITLLKKIFPLKETPAHTPP